MKRRRGRPDRSTDEARPDTRGAEVAAPLDDVDPVDLEPINPGELDVDALGLGDTDEPLLSVRHLSVEFPTDDGVVKAVDDVSFDVGEHEVLGVVGESGSGKSVTALSVLQLAAQVSAHSW